MHGPLMRDDTIIKLAALYVLAYIAQAEFVNEYFANAYHELKSLEKDTNYKLSKNQVGNHRKPCMAKRRPGQKCAHYFSEGFYDCRGG